MVPALFAELPRLGGDDGGAWLSVDHVTIWRWVQRYAPILNQRLRRDQAADRSRAGARAGSRWVARALAKANDMHCPLGTAPPLALVVRACLAQDGVTSSPPLPTLNIRDGLSITSVRQLARADAD
jgi:hypothetical protein